MCSTFLRQQRNNQLSHAELATIVSTPTVTYRQLDANNDPLWGQGTANYVVDTDAVALMIQTRLLLFVGEWWSDLQEGLPLWQKILGVGVGQSQRAAVSLLIQERILRTPYVTGVSNVQFAFNSSARSYQFSCSVTTQFGVIPLVNSPALPS